MTRITRALALLAVLLAAVVPAAAQFDAPQTYVASSTGSGTAIQVIVPNVSQLADLKGVPLRVLMSSTNASGPVTLQVNSLVATTVSKPTTAGLAALSGGEIVTGQINEFTFDGTVFELTGPNLNLGTVQAQNGFSSPINLSLSCTAVSNALTCSMLSGQTGGNPSALSPIYVPFRNATSANGGVVWRTVTSAASFTISGGNTMGCVSASPCRLWLLAADNAGTVQVCAYNAASASGSTPILAVNEGTLQSSGAGTGGGSATQSIFCNASSLSGVAVRYIGYVEYTTLTTAGNWTTPNFVQLFGPGVARPGTQVGPAIQVCTTSPTTLASGSYTSTPVTTSPTLSSAANAIEFSASGSIAMGGVGQTAQIAMFRGTTQVGPVARSINDSAATAAPRVPAAISQWIDFPGTATPTYTVKGSSLGNSTWPDGGTLTSVTSNGCAFWREIMGANDNFPLGFARKAA